MDYDALRKWAENENISFPDKITPIIDHLITLGYFYCKYESKTKWNEYQKQWRHNNPEKTKAHWKKNKAREDVKEKNRAYSKKHYERKKQQKKISP